MGLMEDLGAWLDQKKKNVTVNAQNLPGLLSSFTQDVQQGAAADKSAFDASRSVMPEVRAQGVAEMNQRGQELGAMAPAGLLGWTAWHGSPHKFDKFDLSKIGTGEGAQAYGHGLYFADAQGVAKSYADALGPQGAFSVIDDFLSRNAGRKMSTADVRKSLESRVSIEALAKDDAAVDAIRRLLPTYKPAEAVTDEALKHYRVVNDAVERTYKPSTYKVDISDAKAPQDAFLQWDKPLSEQPKRVQDAMLQTMDNIFPGRGQAQFDAAKAMTAGDVVAHLSGRGPMSGEMAKRTSETMKDSGIPGIRYLDGGSRGFKVKLETSKGPYADSMFPTKQQAEQYAAAKAQEGFKTSIVQDGTMNTVLFDDSLVKILERNGQPLGLLGR
jgi:hypothetical protein